jgi:hypothetical protein
MGFNSPPVKPVISRGIVLEREMFTEADRAELLPHWTVRSIADTE